MTDRQTADLGPHVVRLDTLDAAWKTDGQGRRHAAVMEGAATLRASLQSMSAVRAVRTLPLTTLVYPARFAFQGMALSPAPFVTLTHRALLVEFLQAGALKRLVFNPTDIDRARATPYFAKLIARFGERVTGLLATRFDTLEFQLAAFGLAPEDIDYVAFDHFHTQDLRRLLGTDDGRNLPRFPNATLLAPKREWDDWDTLHPMQKAWFVAEGKHGVHTGRVALTDGDLQLGEGVMLVRTPGHTSGNQTLFLKTDRGLYGCSENGTAADNWSPTASKIAGLASAAEAGDLDVVLNANTPEYAADQYTSMSLERAIVDRVSNNTDFVQMFPSSEVTPSLLGPGLSPTYQHLRIESGALSSPTRGAPAQAPAKP